MFAYNFHIVVLVGTVSMIREANFRSIRKYIGNMIKEKLNI